MPKLKVPGERPAVKESREDSKRMCRKRKPSKDHGSEPHAIDTNRKLNTSSYVTAFHAMYEESGDELDNDWEGYHLFEINTLTNGGDTCEGDEPMDTAASNPSSPAPSSSSYDTPSPGGSALVSTRSRSGNHQRKRGVRCMECTACVRKEDCGECINCTDKPKYGGPGTRKQACVYRKCLNLLRNLPLKQPPTKKDCAFTLPATKRSRTSNDSDDDDDNEVLSGSRIMTMRPKKVVGTNKGKDDGVPNVHLHWPDSPSDYIGYPVYSFSNHHVNVCVRCGSAGIYNGDNKEDLLLYCQVCCQPYHWFCIGRKAPPTDSMSFTCNRCVSCNVCGLPNECSQCAKCKLWFHEHCLLGHTSDPTPDGTDRFKCVQCTWCISCKADAPSKMEVRYSNMLSSLLSGNPVWSDGFNYCNDCFELKRKGNTCPVCGECYLDNDFDSKMMQCGKCDSWIHSHCDNMSNEDYEILSDLPDSIEYVCKFCFTDNNDDSWRTAIMEYKKEAYDKLFNQLQSSLGTLWPNDATPPTDPLPTVDSFTATLEQLLEKCGKSVRTGSKQHRLLYSTQQDYNKTFEDLFPWYTDVYGSNSDNDTNTHTHTDSLKPTESVGSVDEHTDSTNTTHMKDWPSTLLNDHCYAVRKDGITENGINEQPLEQSESDTDLRYCSLCYVKGDQPSLEAGRLIPCSSVDDWVHVNCAIWSAEVYEDTAGLIYNVHTAISRGQRLRCDACKVLGATVGCCCCNCSSNYHYMCARRKKCIFLHNKEVYCQKHASLGSKGEIMKDEDMKVTRCILIYTDLEKPGKKTTKTINPAQLSISIGSLHVERLGTLTPLSDTGDPGTLLPDAYSVSCDFWSVKNPHMRTRYNMKIQADPGDEEDAIALPFEYSKKQQLPEPLAPDDDTWPCIDIEVGGTVNGYSQWASLAPIGNGSILSPMLLQAAYELLKANSDSYPVPMGLKSFKIPKRAPTKTKAEVMSTHASIEPLDSEMKSRYYEGACPNMSGVYYEVNTSDGSNWIDSDLQRLWCSVIGDLQEARQKLDLPFISLPVDNVLRQFGLSQPLVVQVIEQLPNVNKCSNYSFHFHRPHTLSTWESQRIIVNPSGCARCEQYSGIRSASDMFSFLMSDHRPPPPDIDIDALEVALIQAESQGNTQRQGPLSDLPVAMRYRACQKTYKDYVDVFQSRIHGLGLFCTQEIDAGDMVIEYAGTVIRSILTDKREKYYESKEIGCYMFRIDNDDVVDATMSGNMARFINHSCEPNCYSKVVSVDNQKKIMIFALRKIVTGEELTYDYKFPIEDAKIPCKCGASKCRKTLN